MTDATTWSEMIVKIIEQKPGIYTIQEHATNCRPFIHTLIQRVQADCFDHAASVILAQAPMAVDPVGYRALAAFLIAYAHRVYPEHITNPDLLGMPVSSPSNEVEKSDTPSRIAVPGETSEEKPMDQPRADYVPESPESST